MSFDRARSEADFEDQPPRRATVGDAPAAVARATIAHHSKSFALASKLLPSRIRDQTAVVYTYCRRADDAVDGHPDVAAAPALALAKLRGELDQVYGGAHPGEPLDPVLGAFADIAAERRIPRSYPDALLAGMAMDVADTQYTTVTELGVYCFRVASVVGLMMCHVFGLRDDDALVPAARLGLAMQLTNISRDVAEDWQRGRLYIPDELLAAYGAGGLAADLGAPLPASAVAPMASAVRELLAIADDNYRAALPGIPALPWRAALAVRAASHVYQAIGNQVRAQDCDVTRGRAVVSNRKKLALVAAAGARTLVAWPGRMFARRVRIPTRILEAHDVGLAHYN